MKNKNKKKQNPILVKEHGPINSIYFSPVEPHNFAVTSSARVQIYSPVSNTVKKTISRFTDIAYSGHIRSDGQLIVAGDATGLIQVKIENKIIFLAYYTFFFFFFF